MLEGPSRLTRAFVRARKRHYVRNRFIYASITVISVLHFYNFSQTCQFDMKLSFVQVINFIQK